MIPLLLTLALTAAGPPGAAPTPAFAAASGGSFGPVAVVRPPAAPGRVVLYLSGPDGPEAPALLEPLRALALDGALVLAVSTPRWLRHQRGGRCLYPAGDLESLAQSLEKSLGLTTYLRPILVGSGPGATVAEAALAQAPAGTFLGAVALGDRPAPAPGLSFCRGSATAHPTAPASVALPSSAPEPLRAAVARLDTAAPTKGALAPSAGPAVSDLPLVEVRATAAGGDAFVLLVTGDGGWAGIDREIAAALAAKGLHVVGLDSLKYFWDRRTPAGLAVDLARIIEHYAAAWGRGRVALVGYSRGADVLPAAAALLAPGPRGRVDTVALLGPGREATFELHLTDFLSSGGGGRPILPDVERLVGTPVVCLYGVEEAEESLCPLLTKHPGATVVALAGAHHFGGDYGAVARAVVRALEPSAPAR
jgi:type IV secretory pathway VirJ component